MRAHLVEMREMVLILFIYTRSIKVRREKTAANENQASMEELFDAHQY